uniref:Odorant receptor n=1 Tax=Eucryptorrhynchus brandti TaxID=436910 RepID=A0A8F4MXP0_EUCBR|nr:odorant receptor 35 [Eucryptorrhynchus brandti]
MFLPNKNKPFYYSLAYLRYTHYYPSPESLKNIKCYRAVSAIIRILTCFVFVQCAIHYVMSRKDNVPVDLSEDIVGMTGLAYIMFFCILYEVNVKKWSKLYSDVSNTSKFGCPPNIPDVVRSCKNLLIFIYVYCFIGMAAYVLASVFLDSVNCRKVNEEKGLHEICGTATPLWWPYNEMDPRVKFFIIVYQFCSIAMYFPSGATMLFMAWECALIIALKIDHLKGLFRNMFDVEDATVQRRRLKFCIQYHQEIIRMTNELNRLHRMHFGQVSVVSPFILSCIGFQLVKRYSVGALIHIVGYGSAIFLVCQIGQTVQDETYNIREAVYVSKWYAIDPKIGKDVKFVLMRCQKPIYMNAIPLGVFSYSLLITIVKTAYSYLTLMYNNNSL